MARNNVDASDSFYPTASAWKSASRAVEEMRH